MLSLLSGLLFVRGHQLEPLRAGVSQATPVSRTLKSTRGSLVMPINETPSEQVGSLVRCPHPVKVTLHRDSNKDGCPHPVRLRISGRMADVHAELERLAAIESVH